MTGASGARPLLGVDTLPPLHVPLRFFATAAVFALLAGLLWLVEGEAAFATRWSGAMLAATHLLVLGFFAMVMFGALFQVIPVLGGTGIPRPVLVAGLVHPGLTGGTLCLAGGLWRGERTWFVAAIVLLLATFTVFVASVAPIVLRVRTAALRPVRLAVLAFVVAVALGMLMAIALTAPGLGIAYRAWTNVHAAWGGVGFGFLLVVGVSHQVVPMFHVTPAFPPLVVRLVPWLLGSGLAALLLPWDVTSAAGMLAIAAGVLGHAVATLRLLARRRRRRPDAAVLAWRVGLGAAALAVLLALTAALAPASVLPDDTRSRCELAAGVAFALAGLGTIVMGMMPKIVAFLAFLHLQRRCLRSTAAAAHLPVMDEFVAPSTAFVLLALHGLAAAASVAAALVPALAPLAGIGVLGTAGTLLALLTAAALRYARASRAIAEALGPPATSRLGPPATR
ncbi:MAG TPA: hypothetical protein VF384_09090 [Planctomycetota bacterium]